MPKYSWKRNFGIFLSFLMTIGPRLLTLTYFFGYCDLMEGFIGSSIFLITYCATFLLPTVLMYQKLKTETDSGKYFQNLLWAFISAPISPCIVIHPRSFTFLFSSVASALAHFALLIYTLCVFDRRSPMNPYAILMGFLLLSSLFSGILHFLSKGKMKSTCFSWCKSKISCCSKNDSLKEAGLNQPTKQKTNDLIVQIESNEEFSCKYKCFDWFKCKKMCQTENSGNDCISLRFVHK